MHKLFEASSRDLKNDQSSGPKFLFEKKISKIDQIGEGVYCDHG